MQSLPRVLFATVYEAFEESEKPENADEIKLARLHPQVALEHAIATVRNARSAGTP